MCSGSIADPRKSVSEVLMFERLHLTLLNLTGPPSEVMPLSMFLTMHGCSTTEMVRDGMGSQGACCCVSLATTTLGSVVMVLSWLSGICMAAMRRRASVFASFGVQCVLKDDTVATSTFVTSSSARQGSGDGIVANYRIMTCHPRAVGSCFLAREFLCCFRCPATAPCNAASTPQL
jgi:hypothetical protein